MPHTTIERAPENESAFSQQLTLTRRTLADELKGNLVPLRQIS
jgi:hypothetical protein